MRRSRPSRRVYAGWWEHDRELDRGLDPEWGRGFFSSLTADAAAEWRLHPHSAGDCALCFWNDRDGAGTADRRREESEGFGADRSGGHPGGTWGDLVYGAVSGFSLLEHGTGGWIQRFLPCSGDCNCRCRHPYLL